jgi:hypothetical protein
MKPKLKKTKTKPSANVPELEAETPLHARRVWNEVRPHQKVTSTIKSFSDGGERSYPQKPHLAPGVPKNQMTTKGYTSPDAKPKKSRGGSGYSSELASDGDYGVGGHTSYGAS